MAGVGGQETLLPQTPGRRPGHAEGIEATDLTKDLSHNNGIICTLDILQLLHTMFR